MHHNQVVFTIFLIFCGAAVFSTLALYLRQSLLIAYMMLGVLFGPWGLKLIGDVGSVQKTGDVGIIFLLFLLGVHLQPQNLLRTLGKSIWVTLISSLLFFVVGFVFSYLWGYNNYESIVIGAVTMFSSTIVGLKLLPTSALRHQHTSEVMASILLLQDLIAIIVLLFINSMSNGHINFSVVGMAFIALPGIIVFAFILEKYVLTKLFAKFEGVREYVFLVAIAWCLGIAELARIFGLSYEIGAFIAGISIAASPIAIYISERLQPLRDFFLVLFFFSVGASFNLSYFVSIAVPALILVVIFIILKPIAFRLLLNAVGEQVISLEVGMRLGQLSEFALLIAYLADRNKIIGAQAEYLIQGVTMLMFVASSFLVVMKYQTTGGAEAMHSHSLKKQVNGK